MKIAILWCVSFLLQTFYRVSLYSRQLQFIAWRMKMKIRYLLAASVVALIAASSAKAADIVHYQEPAVPAFSWQGFYIGGQIGGAWSDSTIQGTNIFGTQNPKWSPDASGFIGGLYAGYNVDVGNSVVLGIETDFAWADISKSKSTTFDEGIATGRLKEKWLGATRVRAGYAADRWLPYIAAGVAYGKVDGLVRTDVNRYSSSKTLTGWTAGGGLDYAMTDNILLRLEYRYTDLGDKSFSFGGGVGTKFKYKTNDFRVGVAYKF